MKTRLRLPKLLLALGLLASFALAATHAAARGDNMGSVPVPTGLDAAIVKAVVIETFHGRGWIVRSATDTEVVAHLARRGHDSTLTMVYDTERVIFYSDSWKTDKKGQRLKRDHPDGWIKNLKSDLPKRLSRRLYQ
jgi:hypothetical protein